MHGDADEKFVVNSSDAAMSIPEPILVVYGEPPKAIATTDLRQARVDEFLASRSLQPKSRKAYQADLRTFMDWCDLAWVDVSRRKVTQFKTFLLKERELALSSVNRVLRTLKSFYRQQFQIQKVANNTDISN
jgi:site-specific recombinase XerD